MPNCNWSLKQSGYQQFSHYSVWVLALLAVLSNGLPLLVKGLLMLIWLLWGFYLRRNHCRRVVALSFNQLWSYQSYLGWQVGYQLQPSTVVWRWVVFLSLYCPENRRRCYIVVSRDQLPLIQFKQLVRLVRQMG